MIIISMDLISTDWDHWLPIPYLGDSDLPQGLVGDIAMIINKLIMGSTTLHYIYIDLHIHIYIYYTV